MGSSLGPLAARYVAALCSLAAAVAAADPADLVLSTVDGTRRSSIHLAATGVLHIDAASGACVDRTNWCGRYRRMDCAPSAAAVASRLLWRAENGTTAAARLHVDGTLSFELPTGTCFDPAAAGAGARRLGLTLRSGVDVARINFDPAAGLRVHAPGEVFSGGFSVDPVCQCAHGEPLEPSNPLCTSHGDHHCGSCQPGFWLDGKVCAPCPVGHECDNGVKTPCGSAARYSNGTGAAACATCAGGSFTSGGASASTRAACAACPAGHACAAGLKAACGADDMYAGAGAAACSACPSGSTTGAHVGLPAADVGAATTRRVCRKCPAGHTCNGTAAIEACAAGYYAAGGSANCIPCGGDTQYAAVVGAGRCESCGSGSFTSGGGGASTRTACSPCPAGHACDGSSVLVSTAAEDVFISEYVEGSCNTKALELHNPTGADVVMNGTHLQWHHQEDFYGHQDDNEDVDIDARGFDVQLDGTIIPAGGTFVLCREQRVTSSSCRAGGDASKYPLGTNEERMKPLGPCDMVVGSSAACASDPFCTRETSTRNAVAHTGDDSIELRLDARPACYDPAKWDSQFQQVMESVPHYDTCGEAIDVVGVPGEDVDDMDDDERTQRGLVDDQGNILFRDFTLRRKASVGQGSPTFVKSQWDAIKHPTVNGTVHSGSAAVSDLGAHSTSA